MARKLIANRISFTKHDNVFVHVDNWRRAQKFADRFVGLHWPRILERYARRVNPLLKDLLRGYQHYWVTSQSEYSSDIIFKSSSDLRELFPRLLSQSAKVSRILNRFHTHKLIAKIPRTRKWRVTDRGRRVMAASLRLRHATFPELYQKAVAA